MLTTRGMGLFVTIALALTLNGAVQARELTLDQRVDCRRAVEEVYWRHRIWPSENPDAKPVLQSVLSDKDLRAKVEASLRASAALEMWNRRITEADLQSEMERIARQSRRPELLAEIVAALGDDPFLMAECFVRPLLADQRVSELADRDVAFADWWAKERDLARATATVSTADVFTSVALQSLSACTNDTWSPTSLTGAPLARHGSVTVWTGSEVIVWGGIWTVNGLPLGNGGLYDPATDSWRPFTTAPTGYPGGRGLTAVWTGTKMIVWGGGYSGDFNNEEYNKGGRYDPASNLWQVTSVGSAVPAPRLNHSAVWTGTRMIVWGGNRIEALPTFDSGGVYDPVSDSWTATATGLVCSAGVNAGGPCQGPEHCPGTCSGGASPGLVCLSEQDCPGRCHNDTAVPCTTNTVCQSQGLGICDAPAPGTCPNTGLCEDQGTFHPSARTNHSAVWTGDRMIVWGGAATRTGQNRTNTGAWYDPATGTWTPTSTGANVPTARTNHAAVWTGAEMIVWGGSSTQSGGRYDPVADTWTATSTGTNVPAARSDPVSVWTGDEMIVWGGGSNTGGRYRPATDTWTPTSTGANVPSSRDTATWTGTEMVVWGGTDTTGGRYCATPACAVSTWYHDADGDGYGATSSTVLSCAQPPGYAAAPGDCNEANAGIHPGVAEVCGDGLDNDCSGTADDAGALAGTSTMSVTAAEGGTVSWTPLAGANVYDVVRGSLGVLASSHGDFTLATNLCLGNDLVATTHADASAPSAGQGYWYVVRGANCAGPGTYDSGAASQVGARDAEIQAAAAACP